MNVIEARIKAIQEEIGDSAGLDPLHDRFRVGAIGAYRDLLHIEFEEVSE